MKNLRLLKIFAVLTTLILCTAMLTSCGNDKSEPSDIQDVNLDPESPDFVMPSSVEVIDVDGMLEGEEGTPQVYSTVTVKYLYAEYPGESKLQQISLRSKVEYPILTEESYTVAKLSDLEPTLEEMTMGDVYYDAKQDFVRKSYYNADDMGKEEVTMRRFFRDITIQGSMSEASHTFKLELQLPIKVKTEPGLTTKEIIRTTEQLNQMLQPLPSEWNPNWIVRVDDSNPNTSTLQIILEMIYFDKRRDFGAPLKHFTYEPAMNN